MKIISMGYSQQGVLWTVKMDLEVREERQRQRQGRERHNNYMFFKALKGGHHVALVPCETACFKNSNAPPS